MNKYSYLDPALTEILAHPIAYPKALDEVSTAARNYNTAIDKLNNNVSDTYSGILPFAQAVFGGDTTHDVLANDAISKAKAVRDKSQSAGLYTNPDNKKEINKTVDNINNSISNLQKLIIYQQIARGLARGGMGMLSNAIFNGGDVDGWDAATSALGGLGGGLLGSHIAELNNLNKTQKALLNVGGSLIGGPAATWLRRRLAY